MKTLLARLVWSAICVAPVAAFQGADETKPPAQAKWKAEVGAPAPDFTLKDFNGRQVTLSGLRGKTVVLEWFNPECPVVIGAHGPDGALKDFGNRASADEKVVWLAVNSGAPGNPGHGREKNVKAAEDWNMSYPVLLDETGYVGRMYGARTTPHMFVIDSRGTLVYDGAIDSSEEGSAQYVNYVEEALRALQNGNPVRKGKTRPYGCSVKYSDKARVGVAAPDFTLSGIGVESRASLSDYRGKVVVLEWFNPECPVVRRAHGEGGTLETAAQRWTEKGVAWLAINSGGSGQQGFGDQPNQRARDAWKLPHPILMDPDGTVGRAYGATTTPQMFVLDQRGVIVYAGAHDDQKGTSYVDQALTAILAGEEVATKQTRSYGCNVKYGKPVSEQ
jgi:peroxiredoxin